MKHDVEHFVRICVKCQNTKSIYKKKYGLYKPLLIPSEPWENVSMDFMTPIAQVEWDWCHICGNWLIFQVGKDGSMTHPKLLNGLITSPKVKIAKGGVGAFPGS
jgi:hypothetical protein